MTGIELIAAERKRQIEKEEYTAQHDDQWKSGEIAIYGITCGLRDQAMPCAFLVLERR